MPSPGIPFVHSRSGVQPTVEDLPKDRHGSGGFCGGFLRWIFLVAKCKRKIRRKNPPENPPAENKKSAGTRPPPKSASQAEKSAAKRTNESACPTSKCTAGFLLIEKDCSWRCLQSMDSGTLCGCLLGMVEAPMLKCTCNPSAAAGGMDKVCCAPFQTTLLVKSVRFEKTAQK